MNDNAIYSRRGGGFLGSSIKRNISSGVSPGKITSRGTWPFAKLTLKQSSILFELFKNQIELAYTDIAQVQLIKRGYVIVIAKDETKNFGFTGTGLSTILNQFRAAGVSMDKSADSNLSTANIFVMIQVAYTCIFAIIFIGVAITILIALLTGFKGSGTY